MTRISDWSVGEAGALRFRERVECGQVLQDVDGYYKWFPPHNGGAWEAHDLKAIGELLDGMNAPWEAEVAHNMARAQCLADEGNGESVPF